MGRIFIDINCDVGEGVGNDKDLLPLISSCNIACGGHAGDKASMKETVQLARLYNVKVGAHPSYPDKENFGRTSIRIPQKELIDSIRTQIHNLGVIAEIENLQLHHIKPHGALYNDVAKNKVLAKLFLTSVAKYREEVFLYVPYASEIEREALKQNFKITYEAFADRNYTADLSLVSRQNPQALIIEKEKVLYHVLKMVKHRKVRTITGQETKILAETFCIHSDTPLAFQIVLYLTEELPNHNIHIK